MTNLLLGAGIVLGLLVVAVIRRGLFDGLAVRKLSNTERALKAWALTENDEIKPLKVCGATDERGPLNRRPEADPEQERAPGRLASPACLIPGVQREIEARAMLDAAILAVRAHPELMPVWLHSHQADKGGQEIWN